MIASKERLTRWRVFVNGTAYMGMGQVNADGTAGPNMRAGDCDFVVASEAVREIERLREVFDEACNEVKMCHGKPCFCKYCRDVKQDEPTARNDGFCVECGCLIAVGHADNCNAVKSGAGN